MYSRSASGRGGNDYRIPDNYRGNAFSPLTPPQEPLQKEQPEQIGNTQETAPEEQKKAENAIETKPTLLLSSLLPPKPTGLHGILGNIGTEELLILGIILLLSGSETDDDILLLLILLLFYK